MKLANIKNILLEHISFDSPRATAVNLGLIILLLALIPTSTIIKAPTLCIFKTIILPAAFHSHCPSSGLFMDCNCPACGLIRSTSRLLHGDIQGSINHNRMGIFVLLLMLYLIAINSLKAFKGSSDKDQGA